MGKFLRNHLAIAAATLTLAGCAVHAPVAPLSSDGAVTGAFRHDQAGAISVPLKMPAVFDRDVQYAYSNNYINTVEVRLRDSLGNESVQYVARNYYLVGSKAAGTVNVQFLNVMPGVFTLTVRTSHLRLLSSTGPVKYDGLRDVFFIDQDGDDAFDSNENEVRVISGNKSTNFLVFAPTYLHVTDVFPWSMRSDTSTTPAGFGVGAATQSLTPNTTTTVNVNVGQVPRWSDPVLSTVREVTAGETVTMPFADGSNLKTNDTIGLADPNGFALSNGIANSGSASLQVYGLTADTATFSFVPTRATYANVTSAATPFGMWLLRGQSASEVGVNNNLPKISVLPDIATSANSRFFGSTVDLSPGQSTTVQYDLRDQFWNLVAGNVQDVNQVPLNSVRRANAGITMDYGIVASSYTTDPRTNQNPFMLPGRTVGTLAGGTYTQGSTAPWEISKSATYSVTTSQGAATDLRMSRLDVPYWVYASNPGAFGNGSHSYTLNFAQDPSNNNNEWVYLQRMGGPVIASSSYSLNTLGLTVARTLPLSLPTPPAGTLPLPIQPTQTTPVIITIPARAFDTTADNGTVFNVTDYGARRVNDWDTVRARVLNARQSLFFGDVGYAWQK